MFSLLVSAGAPSSHATSSASRPLRGGPVAVGHHRDAGADLRPRASPRAPPCAAASSQLDGLPPKTGQRATTRDQHARDLHVDAERALPSTLSPRSSRGTRLPMILKSLGSLSVTCLRHRQRRGAPRRARRTRAARRLARVDHLAHSRCGTRRRHAPGRGGGGHQHRARPRAGLAQRLPRRADAAASAGALESEMRVDSTASAAGAAPPAPAPSRRRAPRPPASAARCARPGPSRSGRTTTVTEPSVPTRTQALGSERRSATRLGGAGSSAHDGKRRRRA